ncbi:MAG TPA: hypothetical protein VHG32_05320 [Thermoanaerobaculia bacterium]|jgi:hypothetical protein|nr:hypothetical protein [Thermoanaerobaculia bacterium]
MSYHWVVVAAVAVLFAWRLFSLLATSSTTSVNDKLSLAVGGVILILVFCFGLVVLIYIAANQIDLSQLLSEPGGGASLSRFQFLIFTFVVSLSLFLVVAHGYTFPDIPAGVLTLLGISASTYAVGKGITASDPEHMASKGPKTTPPPTKSDAKV